MSTFVKPERPQIFFHVEEMTSERSATTVTDALMQVDDRATVRINLPLRRIEIDHSSGEPSDFASAIRAAGFNYVREWPAEEAYI